MQQAKGDKPEIQYDFIIEFGLHCFTHGPNENKGETLNDYHHSLYYRDSREIRIFCFKRHELSRLLPEIAKGIDSRKCFHTGKGNFFTIELPDGSGGTEEYEIYFNVTRTDGGKLRLFVQSAFVRDDEHDSAQPKKKPIKFLIIAHNRRVGKKIKTPR